MIDINIFLFYRAAGIYFLETTGSYPFVENSTSTETWPIKMSPSELVC